MTGGHTVTHLRSIWNGGTEELDLSGADVLFIFGNYLDTVSSTVHVNVNRQTAALLQKGAVVVMFLNNAMTFHIQNLLNIPSGVYLGSNVGDPSNSRVLNHTAFDTIFSRFGTRMTAAKGIGFEDERGRQAVTDLLRHSAGLIGCSASVGSGVCVYLPLFSDGLQVMRAILDDVLPSIAPHLIFDPKSEWIRQDQYLLPSLLKIRDQERQTEAMFKETMRRLETEYSTEWTKVQEKWTPLLIGTGDQLKTTVKEALERLGLVVEDVDKYWASNDPSRQKEEDLWASEQPGPAHPSHPGVRIIEVKSSGRGSASEGDYSAITKYLNRRKSQFRNTDLYGLFVMNHFYHRPAAERPAAFSSAIEKDAIHDRVTLVTTWDLYRILQRIAGGELSDTQARLLLADAGIVKV